MLAAHAIAHQCELILEIHESEIDCVSGGMAWIGRAVTGGLILVGCGTGVALVAGIAVGIGIAYLESQ